MYRRSGYQNDLHRASWHLRGTVTRWHALRSGTIYLRIVARRKQRVSCITWFRATGRIRVIDLLVPVKYVREVACASHAADNRWLLGIATLIPMKLPFSFFRGNGRNLSKFIAILKFTRLLERWRAFYLFGYLWTEGDELGSGTLHLK